MKFIPTVVIYPKSELIQEMDWRQAISLSNVDRISTPSGIMLFCKK